MDREEQIAQILTRLETIEMLIDSSKMLYKERDELTDLLRKLNFTEMTRDGKSFKLTDNFADKNTCYRMAFVRRWEIKIKEAK